MERFHSFILSSYLPFKGTPAEEAPELEQCLELEGDEWAGERMLSGGLLWRLLAGHTV